MSGVMQFIRMQVAHIARGGLRVLSPRASNVGMRVSQFESANQGTIQEATESLRSELAQEAAMAAAAERAKATAQEQSQLIGSAQDAQASAQQTRTDNVVTGDGAGSSAGEAHANAAAMDNLPHSSAQGAAGSGAMVVAPSHVTSDLRHSGAGGHTHHALVLTHTCEGPESAQHQENAAALSALQSHAHMSAVVSSHTVAGLPFGSSLAQGLVSREGTMENVESGNAGQLDKLADTLGQDS